jgi:peptide methionine sulfoxide reductase MsrA
MLPTLVRRLARTSRAYLTSWLAAYRQVCSGTTGHAESVKLTYQKGAVGYGEVS